ncbi:MAG: hypothetical protein JWN86_1823 [Planctomycetota bacterium]|nr:hypothetical protein [Planctomycetota bacterium]
MTLLSGPAAHAGLVFTVNDVTAAAGSTGNTTLEVSLTNDSTTDATPEIAAFQFRLMVSGASGVTFTDADILTANNPYIFGTNTSAPPLSFDTFPNTTFTASDIYTILNSGVALDPLQTVGLGRVTFDVAPSAGGLVVVTIVPNFTDSVLDPDGNRLDLPYTFVNGSINVTPVAVPEPSSLVLALVGITAAFLARASGFQATAASLCSMMRMDSGEGGPSRDSL